MIIKTDVNYSAYDMSPDWDENIYGLLRRRVISVDEADLAIQRATDRWTIKITGGNI